MIGLHPAGLEDTLTGMNMVLEDILDSRRSGRISVWGVLNITPDSFSDGGKFLSPTDAVRRAEAMLAGGADVIDIGAESTRPGSRRVAPEEQIARLGEILPTVCLAARASGGLVSIDTTHAAVARFALDHGAAVINDISAGREDPDMFALAAEKNAAMILMHMQGQPGTMQTKVHYEQCLDEVKGFLANRLAAARDAGVPEGHCIVDPGIGFGKLLEHNLELLGGLRALATLAPVMVGVSRKRFIGELTGQEHPEDRLAGTIAACVTSYFAGATLFRVHDVRPVRDALLVTQAIEKFHQGAS